MKQVLELKNISEETQLVLNENLEKVEVESGETFRTTERSYLKNYAHIFALATDEAEKKDKKSDSKSESKGKKAKDQTPVDPEPTVEPQNNDGGSVEEKKAETDPVDPETEATDSETEDTSETQGAENTAETEETSETEEEEEKKAESETQETA